MLELTSQNLEPNPPLLPPLLPGDLKNALSRALGATTDEGNAVVIDTRYGPTEIERQRLQNHLGTLRFWLQPATRDQIAIEVYAILMSMGSKGKDETDYEAIIRIYVDDLLDLPLFALKRACKDFRRGRKGNRDFAPTQANLRAAGELYCEPWEKTRAEIARVLNATPSRASVERKAEMLRLMAATKADLVSAPDPYQRPSGGMSPQEIESARQTAACLRTSEKQAGA